MNKQLTFILLTALAVLGIAGIVVLLVLRPEATDQMMTYLTNLLMLLAGFGGLATQQASQNKEIATIKRNTNGTLTALRDENAELRAALAQHAPNALIEQTGAVGVVTRAQLRADREDASE